MRRVVLVKILIGPQIKKLPPMQDPQVVGQQPDFRHAMRREEDGFTFVPAAMDETANAARSNHVEPGGRFIQNDDTGLVNQGAHNRHFLFHAGRKFGDALPGIGIDLQQAKEFVAAASKGGRVEAVQISIVLYEFVGCEAIVEGRGARQETEMPSYLARLLLGVIARHGDGARCGTQQRGYGAQGSGLSSPIRPDQTKDPTRLARKADPRHGVNRGADEVQASLPLLPARKTKSFVEVVDDNHQHGRQKRPRFETTVRP